MQYIKQRKLAPADVTEDGSEPGIVDSHLSDNNVAIQQLNYTAYSR